MRKCFLFLSLFIFLETIIYWGLYDPFQLSYQFGLNINLTSICIHIGIDGLSLFFIFLISFLIPCCILFNWNSPIINVNEYCICLFCIECILIFVFSVSDLLLFYLFFESVLMPMFIFVGIMGLRTRRIHAAYLLFFYTLIGSLFMLGSIVFLYLHIGTTDMQFLQAAEISFERELVLWLAFFLSFSIKIPMFPFHIWLPEAHVEAPTEGSVLLAGVLLKMGSYGFIRVLISILWGATIFFMPLVFLLSSMAIVYTSLVTLRQIDMKRVIAYSSIAHMNISVLGLFVLNIYSLVGSVFLMIGHGIVSAALFFMVGILYDRYKTRLIKYYSGLVQIMPIFSLLFLFAILGNVSFPATCNFIGEVLVFFGLIISNMWSVPILFSGIFICTVYSFLMYNHVVFGFYNFSHLTRLLDLNRAEFFVLLPFCIFIFLLGLIPSVVVDNLMFPLYGILFV